MATKKAIKTYEVEVSMTWSQSYTVKAKTAAEARRKAKAIKTYEVEVSMTWSQSYTVKAKTAAEARRKARTILKNAKKR